MWFRWGRCALQAMLRRRARYAVWRFSWGAHGCVERDIRRVGAKHATGTVGAATARDTSSFDAADAAASKPAAASAGRSRAGGHTQSFDAADTAASERAATTGRSRSVTGGYTASFDATVAAAAKRADATGREFSPVACDDAASFHAANTTAPDRAGSVEPAGPHGGSASLHAAGSAASQCSRATGKEYARSSGLGKTRARFSSPSVAAAALA